MNEKIVTICIPAYNCRESLGDCLASLIDRRYVDLIDIIVVNNSSTDNTSEIAYEYQQKYPQSIRVYTRERRDVGGAYNIAIEQGIGYYLIILDDDDMMDIDRFLRKMQVDKGTDLISYQYDRFGKGIKHKSSRKTERDIIHVCIDDLIDKIPLFIHSVALSMKLLRQYGIKADEEYIQYADNSLICRTIIYVRSVSVYQDKIYWYRIHDKQGLSLDGIRKHGEELTCCAKSISKIFLQGMESGALSYSVTDRIEKTLKGVVYSAYRAALISETRSSLIDELNKIITGFEWKSVPVDIRLISLNNCVICLFMKIGFLVVKGVLKVR